MTGNNTTMPSAANSIIPQSVISTDPEVLEGRNPQYHRLAAILLAAGSLLLLLIAVLSLQWRFAHDSPLMLYVAFLIDHFHAVPYRDVFDMNLPGSYFLFYLIGHTTNYSDIGFRIADLLYLGGILAATWLLLKGLGGKMAWAACVLFGLFYLGYGPFMSLQREYLLILPLCLAVFFATGAPRLRLPLRAALIGLLFGICATIKPHAIIAYPLVLWYLLTPPEETRPWLARLLRGALPSLLAFLLPIAIAGCYLAHAGALPALTDIASGYWPLYGSLTGAHRTIAGAARWRYLLHGFLDFGLHRALLLPALAGLLLAIDSALPAPKRRLVRLLAGLTVCYALYPLFSGQFWDYHWLIFLYWICVLVALSFAERPAGRPAAHQLLPLALFLFTLALGLRFPAEVRAQLHGQPLPPVKEGRVDAIAGYLRAHLRAGDRVQPLDWTGGAVHALLLSRARLATPFMYDFHFYHHVSHRYTQELRQRFLRDLTAAPPRYIVEITRDKPWVSGADTTRDFPDLYHFIAARYTVALRGDGFIIYELK